MNPPPYHADETRSRIVMEAERLFKHYGYAKTTVADIAQACGMSSANVYRFFASKAEINEAICDYVIADAESRLQAVVSGPGTASERLTTFIACMAQFTIDMLIQEKKVHDMVVVAMEEQWGSIQRHLDNTTQMIRTIIESGVASGEFVSSDTALTARCVHHALCALKHPVVVAQCRDDPAPVSPAEMAAFLLRALKA